MVNLRAFDCWQVLERTIRALGKGIKKFKRAIVEV